MTFAMAEVIKGKVSVVAALIQSLISHKPTRLANTGTHSSLIELTELQSISTLWPVRNYTSWLQRHMRVNSLPKVTTRQWKSQQSNI